MPKPFWRVSIETERTIHTADHEVLLSFRDDAGAEAFNYWWGTIGAQSLADYCANDEEFDHLFKE